MAEKESLEYIKKGVDSGFPIDQLLEAAVEFKNQSKSSALSNNVNIEIKNLTASKVLLFLGGLITVIAGIIYITLNWKEWNSIYRILAIFLPMLISYSTGVYLWFYSKYQKQSLAFLCTGSLLFPFFLMILFKELHIFDQAKTNELGLTISVLSFIQFLVLNLLFKSQLWPFLYGVSGIFVHSFLYAIFKWDFLGKYTQFWTASLLGLAYLILGTYLNEDKSEQEYGKYLSILGALTSVASILLLIFTHKIDDIATWYMIVPIVFYFFIGCYFEAESKKSSAQIFYFLGCFTVFITSIKLAIGGQIMHLLGLSKIHDPVNFQTGFSVVIVGILYLVLAAIFRKMKSFRLELLLNYSAFFDFFAVFFILGGIFNLGLSGKYFVYETLLLVSSLGFIFWSIPKKSISYLYIGTLFLVIYIFDIGGEYFQNSVGWPITLFISGLVAMGIGILMEKLRRDYFSPKSNQ